MREDRLFHLRHRADLVWTANFQPDEIYSLAGFIPLADRVVQDLVRTNEERIRVDLQPWQRSGFQKQ